MKRDDKLSFFQNPVTADPWSGERGFGRTGKRSGFSQKFKIAFFESGVLKKPQGLKKTSLFMAVMFGIVLLSCSGKSDAGKETLAGDAGIRQGAEGPSSGGIVKYTEDGKRIITIGTWYDRYYVSRHTAIEDDPKLAQPDSARMRLAKMREVEQKYNIVLNYVNLAFEGVQESIDTSIPSGRPDVDIYETDLQFGIPSVFKNYGVSLREMGLEGTDIFGPQHVMRYLSLAGQDDVYLFAPSNAGGTSAYVLAFNMDMIRTAGLPNPQDLYDRQEWTWDRWRDYLKRLTMDTDGDGTPEIYGYGGWWTNLLTNLLFSNHTGIALGRQEELSSPAAREVLEFINTIYNVDKTARPWDSQNWEVNNNLYTDGLLAFWIGADWIFNEHNGADLPFEIGVVPWPRGPHGSFEENRHSQPQGNWYFIPRGVENPRFVYDVIFDWSNWYNGDISIGMDNSWSKQMYMNDRNFSYAVMMSSRGGFDLFDSLGTGFNLVPLLTGEMTPSALVETYRQPIQDALDNLFK
jgi:hypothetical protein